MTAGAHVAAGVVVGAVLGGVAALLPDLVLWTFGWRQQWLEAAHPLVRAHRALHGLAGLPVAAGLAVLAGWATHVWADAYVAHRTGPPAPLHQSPPAQSAK